MPYFKVLTPPASEPITLAEAKERRKLGNDEDATVTALIISARIEAENYSRRKFITQTLIKYYDDFPDCIMLECPPIQSVSAIRYYDINNILQTLSTSLYQSDIVSIPSRIIPTFGNVWPTVYTDKLNAVEIEYVVGYGAASAVPDDIKAAIYLMIGHLYENREDAIDRTISEIPMGSRYLLDYYRDMNDYSGG